MRKPLQKLAEIHYGKSPSEVIHEDGRFLVFGTGGAYARATRSLFQGPAVVVPRKGSLGNPQSVREPFWCSDTTYAVLPLNGVDARWLYYNLSNFDLTKLNEATGVPSISREWLNKIAFNDPGESAQQRIAEILSTVDEAIEATEALIAKTRAIKAGLMHDLFTRGVTPDGQLRPSREQAPHLYKPSPLGWIPTEWQTMTLAGMAESLIDGPFGSNLKTEHYVKAEGVRVVRLQNILNGAYDDSDKAHISQHHAEFLARHQVLPEDILIAALGEESHPVGRACCYPLGLPPAINKADCFRLRCSPSIAVNGFVMGYLNTPMARRQVCRYEQGVTRRRINLGNLRRVKVALPSLEEQITSVQLMELITNRLTLCVQESAKLKLQKAGLMHDLLTGRVPIAVSEENQPAQASALV